MKAIVSQKGQVTIPKPVRDRLGLRMGTVVEFSAETGRLIGVKATLVDPIQAWRGRGRMAGGATVNSYLDSVRGGHAHRR
jgi:AbrB family looped-hinge helix DNA binding protein